MVFPAVVVVVLRACWALVLRACECHSSALLSWTEVIQNLISQRPSTAGFDVPILPRFALYEILVPEKCRDDSNPNRME